MIDIESGFVREANRLKETVADEKLLYLWLIMPTASEAIRRGVGFARSRIPGVYRLPKLNRVGLIVVHQLAVTEATLWLRLLGSEGNQNRAIQELVTQPPALYASIEEVLADYRADLESIRSLTKHEDELIMNLSVAYLKKKEEWREEGWEAGKEEIIMNMLRTGLDIKSIRNFTGLSIEAIEKLRDRL
jgi:predicted transposase YdaD